MGATDSKLQFKNHLFRLFEEDGIPADDEYWAKFWQQPEVASDIFTLFTASEIRNTRDHHLENLETLILTVASRLFYLYNHVAFPSAELAPAKELINCIRILTRIMPFIYEQPDIKNWEHSFFWGRRRTRVEGTDNFVESPPLAEQLIDTSIDLLFYCGFTIPRVSARKKVVHSIWETGVGCSTPITSSQELLSNKVEVLRFLLTLMSDGLYQSSTSLAANGSKYLTYMVTKSDKHSVMAVLCSLLNVTLKYSPGWKVPYDHMLIADRNRQLVTYSLQLLEVLLVYPLPQGLNSGEDDKPLKNLYRHYLSKIHKPQDFQFISDSLQRLLTQPIQASSSYLPGSRREIEWVTELTMLFWDLIQCNKKFKAYMIMTSRVHDFTVLLLYYMHEKKSESNKQSLVRLCTYVLLHLSADENYAKSLFKPFEGQNALPNNIKLPTFNGTYADYLIIQLFKCVSNSVESFLIPTVLDIIYNISPYISDISYLASSSLMQLLNALSAPSFFLANEHNKYLLESILRALNMSVHCNFNSNKNLIFALLRNEKGLKKLQELLQNGKPQEEGEGEAEFVIDDEEDRGVDEKKHLSAKAKGKLPQKEKNTDDDDAEADAEADDVNGVSESLQETWALVDELLLILRGVKSQIPAFQDNDGEILRGLAEGKTDPHVIIDGIGAIDHVSGIDISPKEPSKDEFIPVKFVWNDSSFGWYESILWGSIFEKEHQIGAAMIDAASVVSPSVINVGVWNNTDIKLFRLQEVAQPGPTFLRPKGAVDAVADSVIQKFGKLHMNFTTNNNSNDPSNNER